VLLGLLGVFVNLFLILLAFFIYIAASGESQQTALKASFEGITVEDVMTGEEELETVTVDTTVSELLTQMLTERHVGYPVLRKGELVGMITLDDAAAVDEIEREAYRVEDVMSTDIDSIEPGTDAMDAFQRMQETGFGRLPVVDETGDLVGIISKTDLMRAFNIIQIRGVTGTPWRSSEVETELGSDSDLGFR
jgi:CBS domain-containing protein